MKLMRVGAKGAEKPAMMDTGGTIRDLSAHVADIDGSILGAEGLAKLAAIDPGSLPTVDASTRIGACVGNVRNVICVGLNYTDHAIETNNPICVIRAQPRLLPKKGSLKRSIRGDHRNFQV